MDATIRTTIRKNKTTSYGLTLVAGLPFPREICLQIRRVQEELESLLPGRFTWYGLDHLHATLFAPLRGRYRESPPLQREELPADLSGFVHDLDNFCAQLAPFTLKLAGVHITEGGVVMVGEHTPAEQLASRLRKYPELDQPRLLTGLHVTVGFLNTSRPFRTKAELERFRSSLEQIKDIPIGQTVVERVWLVHYANRTLNRIVGKIPFALGCSDSLIVERLLEGLGIDRA